jgi:hypothetical protein
MVHAYACAVCLDETSIMYGCVYVAIDQVAVHSATEIRETIFSFSVFINIQFYYCSCCSRSLVSQD